MDDTTSTKLVRVSTVFLPNMEFHSKQWEGEIKGTKQLKAETNTKSDHSSMMSELSHSVYLKSESTSNQWKNDVNMNELMNIEQQTQNLKEISEKIGEETMKTGGSKPVSFSRIPLFNKKVSEKEIVDLEEDEWEIEINNHKNLLNGFQDEIEDIKLRMCVINEDGGVEKKVSVET